MTNQKLVREEHLMLEISWFLDTTVGGVNAASHTGGRFGREWGGGGIPSRRGTEDGLGYKQWSPCPHPTPHQVHSLFRHSVTSPLATFWLWPTTLGDFLSAPAHSSLPSQSPSTYRPCQSAQHLLVVGRVRTSSLPEVHILGNANMSLYMAKETLKMWFN